jgi:hypothetical protein
VIEMDAASHTSVEDAREIIERVQFRPTSGAYKVYIIDEVHMLSTAAFNALKKHTNLLRDVKATDWQGDRWLIEEGLRVGERVMVDGFQRVVPGAQVKTVQVSPAASAAGSSGVVTETDRHK